MHDDSEPLVARSAGYIVRLPVFVVFPYWSGNQVIDKLGKGRHVLVLFALRVSSVVLYDFTAVGFFK